MDYQDYWHQRRQEKRDRIAREWDETLSWMDDLTPEQRRWHQIKTMFYQLVGGAAAGAVAYALVYWWLPDLVSSLACGTLIDC